MKDTSQCMYHMITVQCITVDFKITFSVPHSKHDFLPIISVLTGLGEGYEDYTVHRSYGASGWGRRGHPFPFKTLTRPGRSVWGYGEWNHIISLSLKSTVFCASYETL